MAGAKKKSTPPGPQSTDAFWTSRWAWLNPNPSPDSHEAAVTTAELRKLREAIERNGLAARQKPKSKLKSESQLGWKVGPCLAALKKAYPEGRLPHDIQIKKIQQKLIDQKFDYFERDTITRAAKKFDPTFHS